MSKGLDNPYSFDSEAGIEKLKQGDSKTWEEVVKCYSGRLRRDITNSLLKRSMPFWSIQDIEQETWLIADRRIGEFKWHGTESLYHWLRVISLYRVLSRIPRMKMLNDAVSFQEIDDFDDYDYRIDKFLWLNTLVQESPENELILKERKKEFLNLLLTDENPIHIELALKRWVENRKPQELAQIYGIDARTISRILWAMRKRLSSLSDFLENNYSEDSSSARV